jgi:hypothetical protein
MTDALTEADLETFRQFAGGIAKQLEKTPADRLAERSEMNHALWTIAHLIGARVNIIKQCGGTPPELNIDLNAYGGGTQPAEAPHVDKATLEADLQKTTDAVLEAAAAITPAQAAARSPYADYGPLFATNAGMVRYLMTVHEAEHLGQLKAWRRACGMT